VELKDDHHCFACGQENPGGLKLDFKVDEESRSISTEFIPEKTFQGYKDITHGGVISTVLDEAMTKLAFSLGVDAVTAKLTVRFKSPLMVGEKAIVTGRLVKESGRVVTAEAVAVRPDGKVIAVAEGLLMRVR